MTRRGFISALGRALIAWPLVTAAQHSAARKIGYLSPRSSGVEADSLAAIRDGLSEAGYFEGKNLAIEYRWAEGKYERLPAMAADLARRNVSVIITTGGPQTARAARAAAPDIPLVFISGSDPVLDGLVGNLNRPEGNTTGVVTFTTSLGPKRLEILRELLSRSTLIGFLVNPRSDIAKVQIKDVQAAATAASQPLLVVYASTEAEIDNAFLTMVERRVGALLMSADLFYQVRRDQVIALAARHSIPTMYEWPEFVTAGGLISYSAIRHEDLRQGGAYAGRILNGTRPADLPIARSTKFETLVNLRTAKSLGLRVPQSILVRADRVIE
jgi:putative ABC transport system substrate-binding protein